MSQEFRSLFSLVGKRVVVSGCASGIGKAIALGVAQAGADVIALDIANLTETVQEVQKFGVRCESFQVDLSDADAIEEIWKEVLSTVQTVDVIFNNAGIQYRSSIEEFPVERFDAILKVNLKASFILSQKVAQHFLERNYAGKIINTASLFSTFGGFHVSAYTSAKHAILGLTKALSNELAPSGICVNAITPGYIMTNVTETLWSDEAKKSEICTRIPMGRWGVPNDVIGAAVFLASSASDYVTGVNIPIDGGYTAR